MTTTVSVVVPIFDGMPWLEMQVESLLHQIVPEGHELEIVLADNGSSDGSLEFARQVSDRDPRVRAVAVHERRGNAAARNLGAQQGSGSILVFTDQDDVCGEGWLAALLLALTGADVAAGSLAFMSHDASEPAPVTPTGTTSSYPYGYLRFGICTNLAVTAEAFQSLGGFDESFAAACDVDFCWRAQQRGFELRSAGEAIVYKRRRPPGGVFRQHLRYAVDDALLYRRHRDRGMTRQWGLLLKHLGWLVASIPIAIVDPSRRIQWLAIAGMRVGRLRGLVSHRVLYP